MSLRVLGFSKAKF
jgi:hypothetical protein